MFLEQQIYILELFLE